MRFLPPHANSAQRRERRAQRKAQFPLLENPLNNGLGVSLDAPLNLWDEDEEEGIVNNPFPGEGFANNPFPGLDPVPAQPDYILMASAELNIPALFASGEIRHNFVFWEDGKEEEKKLPPTSKCSLCPCPNFGIAGFMVGTCTCGHPKREHATH